MFSGEQVISAVLSILFRSVHDVTNHFAFATHSFSNVRQQRVMRDFDESTENKALTLPLRLSGTQHYHLELEQLLSDFLGVQSCVAFGMVRYCSFTSGSNKLTFFSGFRHECIEYTSARLESNWENERKKERNKPMSLFCLGRPDSQRWNESRFPDLRHAVVRCQLWNIRPQW